MHALLKWIAHFLRHRPQPSREERYLAQSVDAQDLEVRLQALERTRT